MELTAPGHEPRTLRVGSDVERLAEVRAFVRDAVTDFGGSRLVADDLVQAVDEAACNVMLHGYGGAPGEIEIVAVRGETPPDPEMGWGAMHEMQHDHDATAANVRIAAPQDSIARVLERTGMSGLFGVDGSRADAVAALQGA